MSDAQIRRALRSLYTHQHDYAVRLLLRHGIETIVSVVRFDDICKLVCDGAIPQEEFTVAHVIYSLEADGVAPEPPTGLNELRGDRYFQAVERYYLERMPLTKGMLLYYARTCQRYGQTPKIDFCDCTRSNPDRDMRNLERRAAQGDPAAEHALRVARMRAGMRAPGPTIAFGWRTDEPGRVDLENCMHRGPDSSRVPTLFDGGRVFWSESYNSYVMVHPKEGQPAEFWHETEGNVNLYSVNGHGEVRWKVDARSVESDPYNSWGGEGSAIAFGLVDDPEEA